MKNPIAEAVIKGQERRASKTAVEAVETAPIPPAPAPAPPAPAPAPASPVFADGAHVQSTDARRPAGVVTGPPADEPVYLITPDDGSPPYKSASTELEPYADTPTEDAPMNEETTAPAALAAAVGLSTSATMGEVTSAAQAQGAALAAERAEARDMALNAAGVKGDLVALVAPSITRAAGQTWSDAVGAHKLSHPSAYASEAPAAAKPALSVVRGSAPMPAPDAMAPAVIPAAEAGPSAPDYNARSDRANARRLN